MWILLCVARSPYEAARSLVASVFRFVAGIPGHVPRSGGAASHGVTAPGLGVGCRHGLATHDGRGFRPCARPDPIACRPLVARVWQVDPHPRSLLPTAVGQPFSVRPAELDPLAGVDDPAARDSAPSPVVTTRAAAPRQRASATGNVPNPPGPCSRLPRRVYRSGNRCEPRSPRPFLSRRGHPR